MAGIDSKFDKAYAGKSVEELADAPVAALNGVSDSDAEHLKAAFNIKTVRDLEPTSSSCGLRPLPSSPSKDPDRGDVGAHELASMTTCGISVPSGTALHVACRSASGSRTVRMTSIT